MHKGSFPRWIVDGRWLKMEKLKNLSTNAISCWFFTAHVLISFVLADSNCHQHQMRCQPSPSLKQFRWKTNKRNCTYVLLGFKLSSWFPISCTMNRRHQNKRSSRRLLRKFLALNASVIMFSAMKNSIKPNHFWVKKLKRRLGLRLLQTPFILPHRLEKQQRNMQIVQKSVWRVDKPPFFISLLIQLVSGEPDYAERSRGITQLKMSSGTTARILGKLGESYAAHHATFPMNNSFHSITAKAKKIETFMLFRVCFKNDSLFVNP